jgi:hypothetical protein
METITMRIRAISRLLILTTAAVSAASCGDVVLSSRSPVMLVVNSISAGGTASNVESDVAKTTTPCSGTSPCTVADTVTVQLGVVMKDVTVQPTTNNQVTIRQYHVAYRRIDGRNTPGSDVPFPFDAAATLTIQAGGSGSMDIEVVRAAAKAVSPLLQLWTSSGGITAIADITFYGTDQVGNDVSVTGSITIDFANFKES